MSAKQGTAKKPQSAKKSKTPQNGAGRPLADVPVDTIESLKLQLERERQERNLFQLERDKLSSFWELSKNENSQLEAKLRNKDREMEELEERHQVEIKVYKQKVKHLLYEHQNGVTQLKSEGETSLKVQGEEHRAKEGLLRKENKRVKTEMKELDVSHEDVVKNLKQEHEKSITKMRQEFEKQVKEIQAKYERKMRQMRLDLDLRRKNEIHEIEERKNTHINELIKKHDSAFSEIKGYYNDITANNLELIKSLKEQLEDLKKKEASDQKLMMEVTMENKRLSEPLQKAVKEVEHLRHELANYNKDKESLAASKARNKVVDSEHKALKWEHEVLEQRFAKVQKERDELYDKFVGAIYDVQQKSGLKNLLLEKKLDSMQQELETREAQLSQVISSLNLEGPVADSLRGKVEDLVDDKNRQIRESQYEIARLKKANNDIIHTYQSKLKDFGIPVEELGFKPLVFNEDGLTTMPAGLVTMNT
eukprot:TRINITY_DN1253_c0_g3_i2.p1 TRINITY_DN1253_c0_g3~~TRINITY_DN1253_c0_g3_i2.p1  ORF type:complete len:489 (+),score=194.17 TRINITY_DN1253_c0_g3_i2:36-1469(+)